MLTLTKIIILAVVQGLAEMLPISSSAHVIAVARLLDIQDTSSPEFVLMLVMLHTGTMFAMIVYFWSAWKKVFFYSVDAFLRFFTKIAIATFMTFIVGYPLIKAIEKYIEKKHPGMGKAEIESLFSHLDLLAVALAAAGVLILISGLRQASHRWSPRKGITTGDSIAIGAIQGLCLPFRGFSRSGATISVGLLRGVARMRLEEFSFALAVVLTPAVVGREAMRLIEKKGAAHLHVTFHDFLPSLMGMGFSFVAGLIALAVLSKLLENGKWWLFGIYCLFASTGIYWMYLNHY